MIEVRRLTKSYGSKRVFAEFNLSIPRAKITVLAGPNGSGKTTLLKCLLGTAVPQSGSVTIAGRLTSSDGSFRKNISYMPQNADFPANLTLTEILDMICALREQPPSAREKLIADFGLQPFLQVAFGKLSGGSKQKFAAVLACMFDSEFLIMDEPTAGLDPVSRVKFWDLVLAKKREGKTILIVSHLMSEIQQVADRLVMIEDGELRLQEDIAALLKTTGHADLDRALNSLLTRSHGAAHELKVQTLA